MTRNILLILVLVIGAAELNAAPRYIDAKPLDQIVKTSVGGIKGGTVLLPLITWGGDIATIYGNGNQRTTDADSIFARNGVSVKLQREDIFTKQLERYISGETPYLRGTLGMINAASDLLAADPRTKPITIYQMTWSAGGDALVVKSGIRYARDLKGKTIAIQAYGPHVDYLAKVLSDAGLSLKDVKIKWLTDLTGSDNSPMNAFYENDVDAAFVIIPDALALTSDGTVGTGAEDSVKGARILLSTKTANRIIADVYAVRSDYFATNKDQVAKLVRALLQSEEELHKLFTQRIQRTKEFQKMISASADILLDSPQATSDTEGLYADAEYVHFSGNVDFFNNTKNLRGFSRLNQEIQTSFKAIGLTSGEIQIDQANWEYNGLMQGLLQTKRIADRKFDTQAVAKVVTKKQQQGSLREGELFSFEVFFQPNQNTFSANLYEDAFKQVIDLASTYGGAIITVEGHSDPMAYLQQAKSNASPIVLGQIKQSARNLSVNRAQSVRDSLIEYAQKNNFSMDASQFAVVGHGIAQPSTGICGGDPCAPKTEEEWRSNMRVEFRIIQVEAEAEVFKPL
jgi:ABC-type nitrate/sulfonate/bicarbonate transport system substrate-binding protein/outer membrane protein OmpA-like peptidoglycan-associated protein